jgi:hypothetical protein
MNLIEDKPIPFIGAFESTYQPAHDRDVLETTDEILGTMADLDRRSSVMSDVYAAAARGTRARQIPAYTLRRPVADWLSGWLPQMSHWSWQAPPLEPCSSTEPTGPQLEGRNLNVA